MGLYDDLPAAGATATAAAPPALSPIYQAAPAKKKGLYDDLPSIAKKVTAAPDSAMRHFAKSALDAGGHVVGAVDAVLGVPQRAVAGAATAIGGGHPEQTWHDVSDAVMHPGGDAEKYQEGLRKAMHVEGLKYHGNSPQWYNRAQNFAVDTGAAIVTDPLNLTPVGWIGKGVKAVGAGARMIPGVEAGARAVAKVPGIAQAGRFISATGGAEEAIGKQNARHLNTLDTKARNFADNLVGRASPDRPQGGSMRAVVLAHAPELAEHYRAVQAGEDAHLPVPVQHVLQRLGWIESDATGRAAALKDLHKNGGALTPEEAALPIISDTAYKPGYVPKQSVYPSEARFDAVMAPGMSRPTRSGKPGYMLAQDVGDESSPTMDRILDRLDAAEKTIALNYRARLGEQFLGLDRGKFASRMESKAAQLNAASDPARRAALQAEYDALKTEHDAAQARYAANTRATAHETDKAVGNGRLRPMVSFADSWHQAADEHGVTGMHLPSPSAPDVAQSGAHQLGPNSRAVDLGPIRADARAAEARAKLVRGDAATVRTLAERTRNLAGAPGTTFVPKTAEQFRADFHQQMAANPATAEKWATMTPEQQARAADMHAQGALARQGNVGSTAAQGGRLVSGLQRDLQGLPATVQRAQAPVARALDPERLGLGKAEARLLNGQTALGAALREHGALNAALTSDVAEHQAAAKGILSDLQSAASGQPLMPFSAKDAEAARKDLVGGMHADATAAQQPYWDALHEISKGTGKITPGLVFNPKTKKWALAGEYDNIPKRLLQPMKNVVRPVGGKSEGTLDLIADHLRARGHDVTTSDVADFFREHPRPPLPRDFNADARARIAQEILARSSQLGPESVPALRTALRDALAKVEHAKGAEAGGAAMAEAGRPYLQRAQRAQAATQAIHEAMRTALGASQQKAAGAIDTAAQRVGEGAGKAIGRVQSTLQREANVQEKALGRIERRVTGADREAARTAEQQAQAEARNKARALVNARAKEIYDQNNKVVRAESLDHALYHDPEAKQQVQLLTGYSKVLKDVMFINLFPHVKNVTVLGLEAPGGYQNVPRAARLYLQRNSPAFKAEADAIYREGGASSFFHERESFLQDVAKRLGPLGFLPKALDYIASRSHDELWAWDMANRISYKQYLLKAHPEMSPTEVATEINRAFIDYAHKSPFTHSLEAIGAPFPHWRTTNVSRQTALLGQNPAAMERMARVEEGVNQDLLPDDLKQKFSIEANTPLDEAAKAWNPALLPGYAGTTFGPLAKSAMQYMSGKKNIQDWANQGVGGMARQLASLVPFGQMTDEALNNPFGSKAPTPLRALMSTFGAYAKTPVSQRTALKRAYLENGLNEFQADQAAQSMVWLLGRHHRSY